MTEKIEAASMREKRFVHRHRVLTWCRDTLVSQPLQRFLESQKTKTAEAVHATIAA
jgi:3'-phosphoadenosine 5'-phosphosulfate sulfotransferase (PAPS reductase)/FAD synthetase